MATAPGALARQHPGRPSVPSGGWRRWRWRWAVVLVALIYLPGWITLQRLHLRRSQLAQELAQLAQDNRRLAEERHQLLTDPSYVEAVARRQLRATRKGETVLKMEPQPLARAASSSKPR